MSLLRAFTRLQVHSTTILPALSIPLRGALASSSSTTTSTRLTQWRLAHSVPTQTHIADHNDVRETLTDAKIASRPKVDIFKGQSKATLNDMVKKLPTKLDMRSKVVFTNWMSDNENECPYIYATGDNNLIGFACLHRMENPMFPDQKNPMAVDLVYVAPSFRRQGLAADLLKECTKHYHITSFCRDEDAASLHRKAGFKQQGIIPKLIVMSYP